MAKKRRRRSRRLPVGVTPREGWGIALEVGGVVQSVSVPDDAEGRHQGTMSAGQNEEPQPGPGGGYWGLMLPPGCPQRALLLGVGGGTVATLLARRCPDVEIVGVESDAEVVAVARREFGLDALTRLRVEVADAFAWVAEHIASEPGAYDMICLDLFQAGRLAQGAMGVPFLRQIATLLAPGGTLTVNLMVTARTPEHLERLRSIFTLRRQLRLRGNLVVHATLPQEGRPSHSTHAEHDGRDGRDGRDEDE